ncbi:ribonuclease [Altererythrobacter sp. B11]|uniref:Rne/Rng family ribonuclease n=1 Tax=Altererythrobacter sp. B11 TaxID=2060312 RepID=UPI000DC6F245|nr:ribonuclease E/G [Altererythrobacter sp. B11]BBC72989.1 ribonuclease [Altererythrobacter sp. B11]
MATRMLIDARHPEETRVAVLKGNRIEEFDFESADHKQIKGNIYLAKVTRVEPSLQAAFVDFGGNRHGFLAFSEIHPDYYQIPQSDREALLAEEQAHADEEAALRAAEDDEDDGDTLDSDGDDYDGEREHSGGVEEIDTSEKDDVATIEDGHVEDDEAGEDGDESSDDGDEGENGRVRGRRGRGRRQGRGGSRNRAKEMDELRAKRQALRRRYKIQDVIQRRQVLLVQVVKEERGNKGAALTTYLSLAGRYCVLMPNSSHGGGISRKISSAGDRKRLKQIVGELSLPRSMGLIVRTAGLQRTKTEIKRDFDYLARLWDEIREQTLASSAPTMIHSDSDLVKRAIRDIYNRDIEEVIVEGEEGYKSARSFMKLLMPSHVRRVKAYSDPVPLFQRFGAEDQLSAMYDPVVQLKSGGYLVINPTEALVSIDINSGRSTKEHGIEQTALNTNLEAAREIARQLRLRDMAGLVVIDFIDMEHGSNVRKVERAMKDALKNDRARIQVGRISGFGLMEMSRQRLRTGVLEATTRACPHCDGTGLVRTASSAGLSALRLIEDEAAKGKGTTISLYASTEAAIYLLNAKRADLSEIEQRYGVSVEVVPEGEDEGAKMRVTSSGPRPAEAPKFAPIIDEDDDSDYEEEEDEAAEAAEESESAEDDEPRKKRRRRRRGGRGRNRRDGEERDGEDDESSAEDGDDEAEDEGGAPAEATGADEGDTPRKRRRRGGRRRRRQDDSGEAGEAQSDAQAEGDADVGEPDAVSEQAEPEAEAPAEPAVAEAADAPAEEEQPKRKPRSRRKKAEPEAEAEAAAPAEEAPVVEEAVAEKPKRRSRAKKAEPVVTEDAGEASAAPEAAEEAKPAKPKRTRRKKADVEAEAQPEPEAAAEEPAPAAPTVEAQPQDASDPEAANDANGDAEGGSPRRGWWQRTFGA